MGTSFGYSSRGGYYNQGMGGTHTAASGRWKYGKYMNYVVMAIIEVIKKKEYDKGSWVIYIYIYNDIERSNNPQRR